MGANYSLVPVDRDEYDMNQKSKLPYKRIVKAFASGDADIVEVRFGKEINRNTVCASFYSAIKRSGLPVKVSARNGKIYLIKKEEDQ